MDISTDFDFLFGHWHIHNHKLADVRDPDCTEWLEFPATAQAYPILGGFGNIDRGRFEQPGAPFESLSLRLYDPATDEWRIYWSSSRYPGVLDPPVIGRFLDGQGRFEGDDIMDGRPVRLRFIWSGITATSATWQQYFRWDGTDTWVPNWTMAFTRTDG
jgi:hypothetical protein